MWLWGRLSIHWNVVLLSSTLHVKVSKIEITLDAEV